MPSSKQRQEVWSGLRARTSGGLTKADLVKNKRGKLVSRKKSGQASSQNNLGAWLRDRGAKVAKGDMLRHKGKPPKAAAAPKKTGSGTSGPSRKRQQPSAAPKKNAAAPKPKVQAAPKPAPKKRAAEKPKPKAQKPAARPKKKPAQKVNPLTQQPAARKSGSGYVVGGNVDLGNVISHKRRRRRRAPERLQF